MAQFGSCQVSPTAKLSENPKSEAGGGLHVERAPGGKAHDRTSQSRTNYITFIGSDCRPDDLKINRGGSTKSGISLTLSQLGK